MIIFGGFKEGIRTNEMLRYNFSTNRWSPVIIDKNSPQPRGRSSHCACMYQGQMYIFGGKDEDHEKLNDMWRFDFQTETWQEIIPESDDQPTRRSGASCDVYGDKMVLFGGIYEITKELNDMWTYDFGLNKWTQIEGESASPKKMATFGQGGSFTN